MKCKISVISLVIILCLAVSAYAGNKLGAKEKRAMDRLLDTCRETKGEKYVKAADALLADKEKAIVFLQEKLSALEKDGRSDWLIMALLCRAKYPEDIARFERVIKGEGYGQENIVFEGYPKKVDWKMFDSSYARKMYGLNFSYLDPEEAPLITALVPWGLEYVLKRSDHCALLRTIILSAYLRYVDNDFLMIDKTKKGVPAVGGKKSMQYWVENQLLCDEDPAARYAAIEFFTYDRMPVPRIKQCLFDKNPVIRVFAARNLFDYSYFKDFEVGLSAVKAYKDETDPEVRRYYIKCSNGFPIRYWRQILDFEKDEKLLEYIKTRYEEYERLFLPMLHVENYENYPKEWMQENKTFYMRCLEDVVWCSEKAIPTLDQYIKEQTDPELLQAAKDALEELKKNIKERTKNKEK